jgi:hypothetical protein
MNIRDFINKKQASVEPQSPEEALQMYSNMSEEELMHQLLNVGACSKGGTSAKELDAFYNNVQGFLTAEQREKMQQLIMQLKMS